MSNDRFECEQPSVSGIYFYKARTAHALAPVQIVNIEVRGGQIFERGSDTPFGWHGLWAGPVTMPAGWDAKAIHEIIS